MAVSSTKYIFQILGVGSHRRQPESPESIHCRFIVLIFVDIVLFIYLFRNSLSLSFYFYQSRKMLIIIVSCLSLSWLCYWLHYFLTMRSGAERLPSPGWGEISGIYIYTIYS